MITKVTRDVLDISTRPVTDGLNVDGDGSTNFTIDGTIIGSTTASTGNFTTLDAITFDANSISFDTILSANDGSNTIVLTGNGLRIVNNNMDFSNNTVADGSNAIEIFGGGIGADDAVITFFNDSGIAHFGLDAVDAQLKYGGGTVGGPFTVWHSGNDGPGSGLDADTLDGRQTGTFSGNIPIIGGSTSATTATTGILALAETSEIGDPSISTKAITPSRFIQYLNLPANTKFPTASTGSGSIGFQRLVGGFLIQWGRVSHSAGGSSTVTLPESFSTINSYQVVAGTGASGSDGGVQVGKISASQFTIAGDTDNTGGPWIAIGL